LLFFFLKKKKKVFSFLLFNLPMKTKDRGPFYDITRSPFFYFHRYFLSSLYLIAAIASVIMIFLDLRLKGNNFEIPIRSLMCIFVLTLGNLPLSFLIFIVPAFLFANLFLLEGRGLRVSIYEDTSYYLATIPTTFGRLVLSGTFWFPLVVGTTAYSLLSFHWFCSFLLSVLVSTQQNL